MVRAQLAREDTLVVAARDKEEAALLGLAVFTLQSRSASLGQRLSQRRMGRKLPYKLQSGRPFTHFYFLLIFLALVDQTLLLSNYLSNSFSQTEQLPKPELPSHSSLGQVEIELNVNKKEQKNG